MDDLISRQAAIDALEREKTFCTAFREGYTPVNVFEKYNAGLTDGIKALKSLPSAQERKTGRWIHVRDEEDGNALYECSVCHMGEVHVPIVEVSYCWNCGADMRGEEHG